MTAAYLLPYHLQGVSGGGSRRSCTAGCRTSSHRHSSSLRGCRVPSAVAHRDAAAMATKPAQQVPIPNAGAAISKWVRAMIASVWAIGLPSGMVATTRCGAPRQMTSSPLLPCRDQHRDVAAHRMIRVEERLHPFDGQPGDLFHLLRVVDNNPLYRLPVPCRCSVPGDIEDFKDLLLRDWILREVPHGTPFLQVYPKIIRRRWFRHQPAESTFSSGRYIQEERLRRAGDLAVPASDAHTGFGLLYFGQGVLIGGIDNSHRTQTLSRSRTGCRDPGQQVSWSWSSFLFLFPAVLLSSGHCFRFFPALHASPACFPSVQ